MPLHHIALGAADPERVAAFYREHFSLEERARHLDEAGVLRSVWLVLGEGLLMVERSLEPPRRVMGVGAGPFLLAFAVSPDERARLEARLQAAGHPIEDRTRYTSYTRDPEGNRVAFSHYPDVG